MHKFRNNLLIVGFMPQQLAQTLLRVLGVCGPFCAHQPAQSTLEYMFSLFVKSVIFAPLADAVKAGNMFLALLPCLFACVAKDITDIAITTQEDAEKLMLFLGVLLAVYQATKSFIDIEKWIWLCMTTCFFLFCMIRIIAILFPMALCILQSLQWQWNPLEMLMSIKSQPFYTCMENITPSSRSDLSILAQWQTGWQLLCLVTLVQVCLLFFRIWHKDTTSPTHVYFMRICELVGLWLQLTVQNMTLIAIALAVHAHEWQCMWILYLSCFYVLNFLQQCIDNKGSGQSKISTSNILWAFINTVVPCNFCPVASTVFMKAPVESRYTSEPLPFTSNTDFICAKLHWVQKLEDVHSQQVLIGVGFVPPVEGIGAFQNTYVFSRVLDVLIVGSCIKKFWKSTPTSPEQGQNINLQAHITSLQNVYFYLCVAHRFSGYM
jgi:hypothetical protein